MAEIFNLPAVGDTMVEGAIVEWFVAVGDVVDLDQPICSIETDKSVVEMSTPHRGTVLRLGADVGGVVEVGQPLLIVGEPGEVLPEPEPTPTTPHTPPATPSSRSATAAPTRASYAASPVIRRFAHEEGVDLATVAGTGPGGRITRADVAAAIGRPAAPATQLPGDDRVRAMPKVRRAAREAGIDLRTVVGTGPHASITLEDLPAVAPVRGRRAAMTPMRRSIARNLTASAQQIPQFTSMVEFDAGALLDRRRQLREATDAPMPIDALLVEGLVDVLAHHPTMNAQLLGDEIEFFDAYDIGRGLVDYDYSGVQQDDESADEEQVAALAKEHQPKLIIAGGSAYPRQIDFAKFRAIADDGCGRTLSRRGSHGDRAGARRHVR